MNFVDLASLALGSAITLMVFVRTTEIEKLRVRVPVKVKTKK